MPLNGMEHVHHSAQLVDASIDVLWLDIQLPVHHESYNREGNLCLWRWHG
jgi:hypothetical protein